MFVTKSQSSQTNAGGFLCAQRNSMMRRCLGVQFCSVLQQQNRTYVAPGGAKETPLAVAWFTPVGVLGSGIMGGGATHRPKSAKDLTFSTPLLRPPLNRTFGRLLADFVHGKI